MLRRIFQTEKKIRKDREKSGSTKKKTLTTWEALVTKVKRDKGQSLTMEGWLMKAAEWNPELSSKYRTNRAAVRPRKRWEDGINEFLKLEEDETENCTESSSQINKTWINTTKDRGIWTLLEDKYTMTAEERHENNARMRRNTQSRPARYVNGVRLSDEEMANIT